MGCQGSKDSNRRSASTWNASLEPSRTRPTQRHEEPEFVQDANGNFHVVPPQPWSDDEDEVCWVMSAGGKPPELAPLTHSPVSQFTLWHYLKTVWGGNDDDPPPCLQLTMAGAEPASHDGPLRPAAAKRWSEVHSVEDSQIQRHWLDREFSEHVITSLGIALSEMLDTARHVPPPAQNPFMCADYPQLNMSARRCIESLCESRLSSAVGSEVMICTMVYMDMLHLSQPDAGYLHPDCICAVLMTCSMMAAKSFDAGDAENSENGVSHRVSSYKEA